MGGHRGSHLPTKTKTNTTMWKLAGYMHLIVILLALAPFALAVRPNPAAPVNLHPRIVQQSTANPTSLVLTGLGKSLSRCKEIMCSFKSSKGLVATSVAMYITDTSFTDQDQDQLQCFVPTTLTATAPASLKVTLTCKDKAGSAAKPVYGFHIPDVQVVRQPRIEHVTKSDDCFVEGNRSCTAYVLVSAEDHTAEQASSWSVHCRFQHWQALGLTFPQPGKIRLQFHVMGSSSDPKCRLVLGDSNVEPLPLSAQFKVIAIDELDLIRRNRVLSRKLVMF